MVVAGLVDCEQGKVEARKPLEDASGRDGTGNGARENSEPREHLGDLGVLFPDVWDIESVLAWLWSDFEKS